MIRFLTPLGVLTLTAWLLGCGDRASDGAPPGAAESAAIRGDAVGGTTAARASYPLPTTQFVAPKAWRPTFGDGPPVAPPDAHAETWRALVNQHEPMQKAAPAWQAVPAAQTVSLEMPAGSSFRCIVTPLEIVPQPDDFGAKLEHWLLLRTVLCSSDGFRSWTSYPHRMTLSADGNREVVMDSHALLQERSADGKTRETYVLFRSDKEIRTANRGEPRILEGVEVTD